MVMEVLERARELEAQGRTVVHMEVGEPDFPTPDFVVEAMRRALDTGESFGYAHSLGDPELREALSRHYLRRYGIAVGPERFLVCPGTSAGMALLFGAVLEPGDKVVLSDPCYSCYPNFVRFCGGVPVFQKVHERDGFRFDPDALKGLLKRERGVKAVMVNSPANPTGAVLDPERMKAIAELGPFVISDEIYHGLNYLEERDHSFLEYTDRCAVVGGLSKSWAMTGWRVGHLALPPDLARPLQTLAQNFVISVNSAVQKAAAVALDEGWPEVERMRSVYDSRRKLLLDGLRRLGLVVMAEPAGAFYILARADHVNPDSRALVFEILEEAGVGCVPGREFGAGAEGFLRFSYAVSSEGIEEALRRLEGFLAARGKLPS
ncbi:MAG: pyridoxal phosphate-dependent aminotransferase [Deltaproteobacteria bacterium]|jgi:aspartate/methionine/tyrosine aminotransferase|nr:pyridoxal phosphate-dependent aminotransferase [Deltaproteobacteria bacterium]